MKKSLLLLVFLFPLLALLPARAQQQAGNDATDVAAAVEKLRLAMLSGKAADLNAIADDNLIYIHSAGLVQNKKEFVDTIVTGVNTFETITISDQQIRVTGGTAVVRNVFEAKSIDHGQHVVVKLGLMLVWQKQGGEWKLLGRQAQKI